MTSRAKDAAPTGFQARAPFLGCAALLKPYTAHVARLPGLVQAEHAGSYRDLTPGNAGEAFRSGDLDVYALTAHSGQPGSGTGGDFYVGDVMATERLEFEAPVGDGS